MSRAVTSTALALAGAAFLSAFAQAQMPPKAVTVSDWAAEERIVPPESGSPYPGRWDNDRVPYLAEPMDVMGLDHPARSVVIVKSAQTGFSEAGMNAVGHAICVHPSPILILLPSIEEAQKYNRVKLQPAIDATPALSNRILTVVSRDEQSSTTAFKRFRGGFAVLTGANSSKGLQMVSARLRLYEEVTEYPADVDGRGEPIAMADARAKAWKERGDKKILIATPGLKGACRISTEYERSDQRRYYVPCPHCGAYQVLAWDRLKWRSETRPHGAYVVCAASGCVIEHDDKPAMLARGAWIRTWPGDDADPAPGTSFPAAELDRWKARRSAGRDPGFAIWQAYSPFVGWDDTVAEWLDAAQDPSKLKVFSQQTLGQPWEVQGEAPKVEQLLERRQKWPRGRVPAGVLFLTGAVDVQGGRLEWAVYGWDRGLGQYLVDVGVIAGNPEAGEPWQQLDGLLVRTFTDAWGKPMSVEAWGVDAGYLSQQVYRFAARHVASQRVRALDGRHGWRLPALGTPRTVSIDWQGRKAGSTQLWPVGTYDLKSEVYWSLEQTVKGPSAAGQWPRGAFYFGDFADRGFLEQLTAEFVADRETGGRIVKEWRRVKGRANEQLDLAVYARALARALADPLSETEWRNLAVQRLGPPAEAQLDFTQVWAPSLAAAGVAAAAPPPVAGSLPPALPQAQRGVRSRGLS